MGWRDFQAPTSSDFVDFVDITPKSANFPEESQQSQQSQQGEEIISHLYNPIGLEEAIKLYRKRGWVQIWSCFLNQAIYLIKNDTVKTPHVGITRYSETEVEALKGLNIAEMKTLHYAKVLFQGKTKIIPEKE